MTISNAERPAWFKPGKVLGGFGRALKKMRSGHLMTRKSWPAGLRVEVDAGEMWVSEGPANSLVRWPGVPRTEDLLAENWKFFEEEEVEKKKEVDCAEKRELLGVC